MDLNHHTRLCAFRSFTTAHVRIPFVLSLLAVFSLNGEGWAQLTTFEATGASQSLGDQCFELTSGPTGTSGAVWAETAIDLRQPFHLQTTINFGSIDHGAEGVVFVLHNEGLSSQGVSYTDFDTSFGVEFDTRHQREYGDIDADHIAMLNDGSLTHLDSPGNLTAGPVAAFVDGSNLEDGNDHVVDIVWDPSGPEMRVSMNCEERLIASIDLIHDIFDGHPIVHWGFTAEADGALNSERVCLTSNAMGTDSEVHICPEASVQLTAGGMDADAYAWAPSTLVSDATLAHPVYTGVVSNALTVTYPNACGVMVTDDVSVVVEDVAVDIVSDGTDLTCANNATLDCIALAAFGNALQYEWTLNNAVIAQDMELMGLQDEGSLQVHAFYPGTSSLQCQASEGIQVAMDTTKLDISAGLPGTITCLTPGIELMGDVPSLDETSVVWSTETGSFDGAIDGPTAKATSGGQYLLTAEWERNGCISVDSVTIGENTEAPEVTLGYIDDALDCNVQEVTMLGLDVFPQEWTAMFEWTDAESETVVSSSETPSFEHAGAYNLTVEFLENGCATEVQDAAWVESEMPVLDLDQMVLPNVITPDNNGRNDRFVPFIPGQEHENVLTMMEEYHIQVHNRWGQLLFQNEGMPLQWDGRAGGQLLDPGAYIVSVQYLATCGGLQSGSLKTTLEVIH